MFHPYGIFRCLELSLFTFGNFWNLLEPFEKGRRIWIWNWSWIWVKFESNWRVFEIKSKWKVFEVIMKPIPHWSRELHYKILEHLLVNMDRQGKITIWRRNFRNILFSKLMLSINVNHKLSQLNGFSMKKNNKKDDNSTWNRKLTGWQK